MVMPRWDVRGTVRGPLAPYSAGFCEELVGHGYAVRSVEAHLLLMARLSRWMDLVSLQPGEFELARVEEFMAWNQEGVLAAALFAHGPAGVGVDGSAACGEHGHRAMVGLSSSV